MEVRKRTRGGKSQKMKVVKPLEVIAREVNGKTITLNFEIDFYGTEFNLTLTENEKDRLLEQLNKDAQ